MQKNASFGGRAVFWANRVYSQIRTEN